MKLEVSKCYVLTNDGNQKKFRVVVYDSRGSIIIKDCKTGKEEDFINETSKGGFSEDYTLTEIDCNECDRKNN